MSKDWIRFLTFANDIEEGFKEARRSLSSLIPVLRDTLVGQIEFFYRTAKLACLLHRKDSAVKSVIRGAITDQMNQHGPIQQRHIESLLKRICGNLKNFTQQIVSEGREPKDVKPGEEGQERGEIDGDRGQGDEGLRTPSSSEPLP